MPSCIHEEFFIKNVNKTLTKVKAYRNSQLFFFFASVLSFHPSLSMSLTFQNAIPFYLLVVNSFMPWAHWHQPVFPISVKSCSCHHQKNSGLRLGPFRSWDPDIQIQSRRHISMDGCVPPMGLTGCRDLVWSCLCKARHFLWVEQERLVEPWIWFSWASHEVRTTRPVVSVKARHVSMTTKSPPDQNNTWRGNYSHYRKLQITQKTHELVYSDDVFR